MTIQPKKISDDSLPVMTTRSAGDRSVISALPSDGQVVLKAQGIRKRYGSDESSVDALLGVDLVLHEGEILGVLGPNGAGKTTLIEILEGLRTPDAGLVELFGTSVQDRRALKDSRARTGVAVQNTVLPGLATVEELVRLHAALFPRGRSPDALIEEVGLTQKRASKVKHLSGGQQQRVAVALALAGDPELLFLDEPTSQLDPHARRAVWDLLEEQRSRQSAAILLTTHQMEEAQQLCDRVLILDHGLIIAEGSPSALIETHCPERIVEILVRDDAPFETLGEVLSVRREDLRSLRVRLRTTNADRLLTELGTGRDGFSCSDLRIDRQSLEDVFIKLTGRRMRDQ